MLVVANKIPPLSWITAIETQTVMGALNAEGQNALFVGGCIRNELMKEDVIDIDIACKFTPQETINILKSNNIRVIETGLKYGTITAFVNKKSFEITSLRSDINPTGRHANVIYNKDWKKDAQRRDFTINALYADIDGNIYDPLESGLADIQSKTIRFIDEPTTRIHEDYLRILRFFRFHGRFGNDHIDQPSFNACKELGSHITQLSDERIFDELQKILNHQSATNAFELMRKAGLFNIDKQDVKTLTALLNLQNQFKSKNIISRFYIFKKLKIYIKNNKLNKFIKNLNEFKKWWPNHQSIPQSLYLFDRDITLQGLLLLKASGNQLSDEWIEKTQTINIPQLPITATDIMQKFNISEGPKVGMYFQQAEKIWMSSNCILSKNEIIAYLKDK
jgi:poly(A) polymerase